MEKLKIGELNTKDQICNLSKSKRKMLISSEKLNNQRIMLVNCKVKMRD